MCPLGSCPPAPLRAAWRRASCPRPAAERIHSARAAAARLGYQAAIQGRAPYARHCRHRRTGKHHQATCITGALAGKWDVSATSIRQGDAGCARTSLSGCSGTRRTKAAAGAEDGRGETTGVAPAACGVAPLLSSTWCGPLPVTTSRPDTARSTNSAVSALVQSAPPGKTHVTGVQKCSRLAERSATSTCQYAPGCIANRGVTMTLAFRQRCESIADWRSAQLKWELMADKYGFSVGESCNQDRWAVRCSVKAGSESGSIIAMTIGTWNHRNRATVLEDAAGCTVISTCKTKSRRPTVLFLPSRAGRPAVRRHTFVAMRWASMTAVSCKGCQSRYDSWQRLNHSVTHVDQ